MFTDTQREKRFEQASDIQRRLYDGYEAGLALGQISQKHMIANHLQFAIAVGDVILGLVPQEKLPDLLIERLQITRPEAMKVTADVLDFLAPLATGVLLTTPSTTAANTTISDNEMLEVEIAQTEATLKSTTVQPMRTMAHDMETARHPEVTHQATSQSDLLTNTTTQG